MFKVGDQSQSATAGGAEELGAAAALVPPPGEIIDTQPNSGWTEGSFSVNDNGAAEYHLPLWVPDGRGGLQPDLALHYNSQVGNGLVGVGWSLSAGLSSITPCARTWAQDDRVDVPSFILGEDAYCLDGQRLRPTDSEWSQEQDYRTERTTFARVRAYSPDPDVFPTPPPPSQWRVWTKDGRVLTYDLALQAYGLTGNYHDAEDPGFNRTTDRVNAAWSLTRIEDRNENEITVEYDTIESEQNRWSVDRVPRRLTYGPDRVVELLYEDRDDPINMFRGAYGRMDDYLVGGVHTELNRRLKTVQMWAGPELLREYRLSYDKAWISQRSQLRSVTECDGADDEAVCMNALEFEWSPGSNTFEIVDTDVTDAAVAAWDKRFYIPGDINGDGRDDLLYRDENNFWKMRFSTGTAFTAPAPAGIPQICDDCDPRVRPIDFDRDGRMDVMVETPVVLDDITEFSLYRSTGSGFELVFSDPLHFHKNLGDVFVDGLWGGFFADIDGNGLPDYLGAGIEDVVDDVPGSHLRWRYRLNEGSGFGSYEQGPIETGPIEGLGDSSPFDYQIRTMTNGQRTQLLLMGANGYGSIGFDEFGLASTIHWAGLPFLLEPENRDRRNLHLADVNGDGLADAVYPCTGMKVQLSSGRGFSELLDGPSEYKPCPDVVDDRVRVRVVDFTGDGDDDLLLIHPEKPEDTADFERGIQVYTWGGRGFNRLPTGIGTTGVDGFNPFAAIQPLDFNGDGLMDIAQVWRTGVDTTTSFIRIHQRNGDIPGKLIRVNVAGLGARVEIDYTTLANTAVHTPGVENCTYPLMCPRRGGSIVSRHRLANGMSAAPRGISSRTPTRQLVSTWAAAAGSGSRGTARVTKSARMLWRQHSSTTRREARSPSTRA